MSRIRFPVALVSALALVGLLSVAGPASAMSGIAWDLQPVSWSTAWTWVVDWLDPSRVPTMAKEGMQMDPDGTPDGSGDNNPADDPPAAAAAQAGSPEIASAAGGG